MKIFKKISVLLALAVVLVLAGQTAVYGAGGLGSLWAENTSARGARFNGPLVMYGLQVLPGDFSDFSNIVDPSYLLHFFLRVKNQGVLYIFTGVSRNLILYEEDIGGAATTALHEFLKKVTVAIEPGWAGCTPDPFDEGVDSGVACPNILRSFENNYVDSEDTLFGDGPDDGDLLSIITNVKLRIPSPPPPPAP